VAHDQEPAVVEPCRGQNDWIDGGKEHVAWEGRPADLFVFAWHPVIDPARVDHCDPRPWLFFVMPEHSLLTCCSGCRC
jgi:hypothetical protein